MLLEPSSPLCQEGGLRHCPEGPPGAQSRVWAQAKHLHCTPQHLSCSLCLHSVAVALPTCPHASMEQPHGSTET